MATNSPNVKPPVSTPLHGQVQPLVLTINATDAGAGTGIPFKESLPNGAHLISTTVIVKVPFSAGAGLVVGSTPGGSDLVAAGDVTATAAGVTRPNTATAASPLAADTTPYASVTGNPTAGQAVVIFTFAAPRATG